MKNVHTTPFLSILLVAGLVLTSACTHRGAPEDAGAVASLESGDPPVGRDVQVDGVARPINFAFDSADLDENSRRILDENIALFKRWPDMQILIVGHTDEVGDDTYNLTLGGVRAGVVREYLLKNGIPVERIVIWSEGEEAADKSAETKAEGGPDRRADFILYWDASQA